MNLKRVCIIALFDLRHSLLRLKGLVFLIPFFIFWYLTLTFLHQNGGKDALSSAESIILFSWLLEPAIAQKLLLLHPATLSVFFVILLGSTPFFAILCSNDQLATDAGRQTFRFLLTRCSRLEIFLGRFFSSCVLYSLALVVVAVSAAWISFINDSYPLPEIFYYALEVLMLGLVYALPFIAYTTAVSAFMSSGLGTLLMCFCLYLVLLVLGRYMTSLLAMDVSLLPGGIKHFLYGMKDADILWGTGGLVVYSLIYLSIAWLLFSRRNI